MVDSATLDKDRAVLARELQDFANRQFREIHDEQLRHVLGLLARIRLLYKDFKDAPALDLDRSVLYADLSIEDKVLPSLTLRGCVFHNKVSFSRVTFADRLVLDGCSFAQPTHFSECKITGDLRADKLNVLAPFDFRETQCCRDTYFRDCRFHQEAWFSSCRFQRYAYFHNSTFSVVADFSLSHFFNVWFNNVTFEETTSFAKAVFSPSAPKFHNARLHRDTSFAGAVFDAYAHEQDWRAYRTLKQHMSEVKAQEEESFFFAHEQRARRKFRSEFFPANRSRYLLGKLRKSLTTVHQDTILAPSAFNNFISLLYDYVSNYGQNIARPFLSWFAQLTAFAVVYLRHAPELTSNAPWLKSAEMRDPMIAVTLSLQNSLNPLAIFSKEPLVSVSSFLMFLIAMIQAIMSISLITLGLLAIRRRFHKGSE